MNVLSSRVVLRVRKPSDVLDLALRFVVENRIPFAKMALIVLPPGVLATWALGRASGWALAWAFAALFGHQFARHGIDQGLGKMLAQLGDRHGIGKIAFVVLEHEGHRLGLYAVEF